MKTAAMAKGTHESYAQGTQVLHKDFHRVSPAVAPDKPVSHISTDPTATTGLYLKGIEEKALEAPWCAIESLKIVPTSQIKKQQHGPFRVWYHTVQVLSKLPIGKSIEIQLRKDLHYDTVRNGLYKAAKSLGVKIIITRERNGKTVYVSRVGLA